MKRMRDVLAGVPVTSEAEIVQHPTASLDAQASRIRELEGQLVDAQVELTRVATRYNATRTDLMRARHQLCETLKESGIKAEFVRVPDELELD